MSYELALPPEVGSVGEGRQLVTRALADWDLDALSYTAVLLTSEILTNSVLHARTPIVLRVERAGDAVKISVQDGSTHLPRRRRHAQDATTGRGLELLERLAQSWRIESAGSGKTLTFTVGGDIDPWAAYGTDWLEADV
jgi:anti-sigma regulatory factor (Ser/Thr protein kinase)